MEKETPVFDHVLQEEAVLEKLGYQQELKRSFSLLGMIGFSFSVVTSWSALGGVLILGVQYGGPPVMIYSWIGISLFCLAVAYSLAEICSAYPVAGGQYSWVAVLAPPKIARGMSWMTGWFMITGILAMGATNNLVCANFILGQANLSFPGYVIERWHTVLLCYAIAFGCTVMNIYGPHLLDRTGRGFFVWNIVSFVVVVVLLLATNDHKQPARFVFRDFQNFTGFGTAYTAILGLLQACFGLYLPPTQPQSRPQRATGDLNCFDVPAHMTEEMTNASMEAPQAIVTSVYLAAVTGFVFLISVCFCIGDIGATALSPTGVPLIQIFYDSTGSVVGACFLSSLFVVICLGAANGLLAETSRSLFAFARDRGLPFSGVFSTVDPRRRVPVAAILLACGGQMVLNSIYFGTFTGFNTVISIGTEGFYLSYAMPLLARILSYFSPSSSSAVRTLQGPWSLGRASIYLNVVGLVFLLFTSITFNFPTMYPVDRDNMNYTSAAVGVIGLISLVTWVAGGKRNFTGPRIAGLVVKGGEAGNGNGVVEENDRGEKRGL